MGWGGVVGWGGVGWGGVGWGGGRVVHVLLRRDNQNVPKDVYMCCCMGEETITCTFYMSKVFESRNHRNLCCPSIIRRCMPNMYFTNIFDGAASVPSPRRHECAKRLVFCIISSPL